MRVVTARVHNSCDRGISVLNYCHLCDKFVNTHLSHSRQLFTIHFCRMTEVQIQERRSRLEISTGTRFPTVPTEINRYGYVECWGRRHTCLMTGTSELRGARKITGSLFLRLRGARKITGSLFLSRAARSPSAMYSQTMYRTAGDSSSSSVHTRGAAWRHTTVPRRAFTRVSHTCHIFCRIICIHMIQKCATAW